jgi:hypothetical protein
LIFSKCLDEQGTITQPAGLLNFTKNQVKALFNTKELISFIVFSVVINLKVRNFRAGIFTFEFKGLLSVDSAVVVVCEGWGRERAILKGPPSGTIGISLPLGGKRKDTGIFTVCTGVGKSTTIQYQGVHQRSYPP